VRWGLFFSKDARKDAVKLKRSGLREKADALLDVLEKDPFITYPPYEKLVGELDGFYSRRITIQHRLVYRVDRKNRRVFVDRMWTHYE
jgi:Txe/YoeB family toxin of toxin-antitoxin system